MTRNTRPVNSAWPQKSRPSWSKSRHDRGEEPTLGLGNISHPSEKGRTTAIAAALSPSKKPNHFAIAEAIAKKLQGRNHRPDKSGNISLVDSGQTRDLAASKAGLGSGKRLLRRSCRARRCKPTYRVWKYFHTHRSKGNPRHGQRTDLSTYGNISISETGDTRVTVETARQFK